MERELKLDAPPGFRLPVLKGIGRGLTAGELELRRHVAIYWDTRDLRLTRWDCGLRHRSVDGWTAKLPAESSGPELVRRELHFEGGSERPPSEAVDLLLGMTRREPLTPLLELHTARERLCIRDAEGRELVEVTNDLVAVMEGGQAKRRFREVEVEFAEDCPRDVLDEIQARLRRAGAGPAHRVPKQVRALGLAAGIEPEVRVSELQRGATLEELMRYVLGRSVTSLVQRDPGVRLDEDVEDVHRMRVATRRLRSHLKTFAPLLDGSWARPLREELRWLGGQLGRVRDADVLGARLAEIALELPPSEARATKDLLGDLAEGRVADLAALRAALRTPRYVGLVEALVQAAQRPALRAEAGAAAGPLLAPELARSWKRLRRRVRALGAEPSDLELHAVRIGAKHLRYAAEAASPIFGKPARRLAAAARGVQQVLGDHQDAVVAMAWLRGAAEVVPGEAAYAAGMLATAEASRALRSKQQWQAAWKKLQRARDRLQDTLSIQPG